MSTSLNFRKADRKEVCWPAIASYGKLMIMGKVRDWSAHGLFFEPREPNAAVLNLLAADSAITVDIVGGSGTSQCTLNLSVRWCGKSQTHKCCGFGAETRVSESKQQAA